MTATYRWECPDCDLRVWAAGSDIASDLIGQIPAVHRQSCKRRPKNTTSLRPMPTVGEHRPIRLLPGVTVSRDVADEIGLPVDDDGDVA